MRLFRNLNYAKKLIYEIPDEYHNSFYLANASIFQIINYFVHHSYQLVYTELVDLVCQKKPDLSRNDACGVIRNYIKALEYCDRFVDLHLPVQRSHGEMNMVRGMRAYHGIGKYSNVCMGGFRLCEDLTRHTAQGFAILSTYRNACYGFDVAGSFGGLRVNAELFESNEMKNALQTYISRLDTNDIADIIKPDRYCTTSDMEFLNEVCINSPNFCITGKDPRSGGIEDYFNAGPKAVMRLLNIFLNHDYVKSKIAVDGDLKNKTFILHGFGRMGIKIAQMLTAQGALCVGIKEHNIVISDKAGIHIKGLLKHYKKYGTLLSFSNTTKETTSNDLIADQCDILILAAIECSISCYLADKIKAQVIVEAADASISPTADKILTAHNKLVLPEILAGGGQTLLSYLEHSENMKAYTRPELSQIDKTLIEKEFDERLVAIATDVISIAEQLQLGLNFREASYVRGIRKIFNKLLSFEGVDDKKVIELDVQ